VPIKTHLYLLAAKWTETEPRELAEIGIIDVNGNNPVKFATDEKATATFKALRWLNVQKPIFNCSGLWAPDEPVKFVGFEPQRIIHHLWLRSLRPDADGKFPYTLPFYVAAPEHSISLPKILNRGEHSMLQLLKENGFTNFPEGWENIGTDIDFETSTILSLCLQLRLVGQEIKSAS